MRSLAARSVKTTSSPIRMEYVFTVHCVILPQWHPRGASRKFPRRKHYWNTAHMLYFIVLITFMVARVNVILCVNILIRMYDTLVDLKRCMRLEFGGS